MGPRLAVSGGNAATIQLPRSGTETTRRTKGGMHLGERLIGPSHELAVDDAPAVGRLAQHVASLAALSLGGRVPFRGQLPLHRSENGGHVGERSPRSG